MAWARTVAVVVPSPATSDVLDATSLTSWAPMFSQGSLSSTSLATVTPSLVLVGEPNFLSRTMFLPRGPSVALTTLLRMLTPLSRECLPSSPERICLAMMSPYLFLLLLLDDREDLFLTDDDELDAVDRHFGPAVLADEDVVALLDGERDRLALIVDPPLAGLDDLGLLGLLLGRVRDDDPASFDLLLLETLQEH